MKFIDLLQCIDCEQHMTVCILADNHTSVEYNISGDKASILKMINEDYQCCEVASVSVRKDREIWVWLDVAKTADDFINSFLKEDI